MILDSKHKSDSLKTDPTAVDAEVSFKRHDVPFLNLSQRFKHTQKDFTKQFAHIYAGRLNKFKDCVIRKSVLKWGKEIPVRKLSELTDERDEKSDKCIVIGTLFKHQELKPSILKEISEENQLIPQPPRSNYVSDKDQLILEDEIQRIRIIGHLDIKKLVTGIVVALLGFENLEGKFEVEDYCFAGVDITLERPLSSSDSYVVMLSGLSLSSATDMLSVELMTDWINGDLCSIGEQETNAKICRVIIAGNSVQDSHKTGNSTVVNTEIEETTSTLESVKMLDDVLLDIVRSAEVDLMPGEFDPTNHTLPQQPMHYCMLPKSSKHETLQSVTNPYELSVGQRRILGSSGQPVDDIKTLTTIEDDLEILESTLHWGHLAPSAPDTLPCYPYYQEEPFIIGEQPDIYFVGNQPEFKTKLIHLNGHPVRLICIPKFAKTQTIVLVNLKTLNSIPVTFGKLPVVEH